jgi:KTSC domain-containing protein
MGRVLDIEEVETALKRAAHRAIHGTREERSGRFRPVQSSTMRFIEYNHATLELDITSSSGKIYRYQNVPLKVYVDLLDSGSKRRIFQCQPKR